MNRLPASGSVIVTGLASRSNTPDEYSVSRFMRTTSCLSIDAISRRRQLAEGAVTDRGLAEIAIGLGADKIMDVDGRWLCILGERRRGEEHETEHQADMKFMVGLPLFSRLFYRAQFQIDLVLEGAFLAGDEAPVSFRIDPRVDALGLGALLFPLEVIILIVLRQPDVGLQHLQDMVRPPEVVRDARIRRVSSRPGSPG